MPLISVFIQLLSLVIHDLRKDAIFFNEIKIAISSFFGCLNEF